jgi:hypothetical protein
MDNQLPHLLMPYNDALEPRRASRRMLTDEPTDTMSNTDNELPKFTKPYIDQALPTRDIERHDIVLPKEK